MGRAALRQLLWVCIIWAVKVEARLSVSPEEKISPWVNPFYDFCEQTQCLRVEDIFQKTVNLYEYPCDDYYKYACDGNYTATMPYPPLSPDADEVFKDMRRILEEDIPRKLDQANDALAIEKTIYKLCKGGTAFSLQESHYYTDTVLVNSGANRLHPAHRIEHGEVKPWNEVDLTYALKGFGFAFFDVDIYEHTNENSYSSHKPGRYIIIKPPSNKVARMLSLIDRYFNKEAGNHDYYGSNIKYKKLENFIERFLQIVDAAMKEIETKEANELLLFTNVRAWDRLYNEQTYKNAKIDWLYYLRRLFDVARLPVTDSTPIIVQNGDYFDRLSRLLQETPDNDVLVNYVHLHFVSMSVGLVESEFSEYSILPQYKGMTACTPGLLVGTAYRYADERFTEEDRKLLESLILKVKNTVVSRVQDAIRAAPAGDTHNVIRSQLNSFVNEYKNAEVYAGYPAWLMNGTAAYSIYGHSIPNSPPIRLFYEYQELLIERLLKTKLLAWTTPSMPIIDLAELRKGFESNEIQLRLKGQPMGNSGVFSKEIVIPFGYFNEKDYGFFSSQLFDPINYGAAATEIAFKLYSELLQRFNYTSNAPRCIKEQIPSHVTEPDKFINRAVAYLLAVDAAHEAWPSKNSYPIQFLDFGTVTDSDLFFLSFAKSLCTIPRKSNLGQTDGDAEIHSYRINEKHALRYYLNFTLQNFKPFLDNHMCQSNHKLYRERECDPFDFNFR